MIKLFLILIISTIALSQLKFTEFRFGKLNPKSTESGFYGTMSAGSMLDANLGYNLELGYFGKKTVNRERNGVDEFNNPRYIEHFSRSTTLIPLFLKLNYVKELNTLMLFKSDIGVGYGFLWERYNNMDQDVAETRAYNGFMFQVGADLGIQISSKGSVYAGIFYNSGNISGDHKKIDNLPTYTEVDMSGIGYRLTIRIDGLGLL